MAKSKYNQKTFPFKVEHYKKQGLSDKQIAENLGISEKTFYLYLKKFSQFLQAYNKGKNNIIEHLENALFRKALGYEYEETTHEKKTNSIETIITEKKIKKHSAPDTNAGIFLLTNLNKTKWKRSPQIEDSEEEKEIILID